MRARSLVAAVTLLMAASAVSGSAQESPASNAELRRQQRDELLQLVREVHRLDAEQMDALREIVAGAPYLGTGNPSVTRHPMTLQQCRDGNAARGESFANADFERICGAPYMAPLYDPVTQTAEQAGVCIDQFEFPGVPCSYPVVWVRAVEAAQICSAMGKRLCDAHEWEGACAGALLSPDYPFDAAIGVPPPVGFERMRSVHNSVWNARKSWAYGAEYRTGICAAASSKSPGCDGGNWDRCGSNTYPTGAFPECVSPLGVYDQHGNAAEHMNLPLAPSQMSSAGGAELGYTEMKGSWFIFDTFKAHEDACRWRAPYWHGSAVMSPDSHHNYHLGFRCCKTLAPAS